MAVYVQLHPRIMTHYSEAGLHATVSEFWENFFPDHGPLDRNTFDKIKTNFELYFENLLNAQMVPIYKHNYEQLREYQKELNRQVLEQSTKMQELHAQYLTTINNINLQLMRIQANTEPKSRFPVFFRKAELPGQKDRNNT